MSEILTKPPLLDATGQEMVNAILAVAGALGADASGAIKHFSEMRQLVRLGLLPKYVKVGDLIAVSKESGISATVTGSVTAATVTEDTFLARAGSAETHAYEFLFDGAAWHLEGEPAELADWGVSITGTPAEGDAVVVHVQAGVVYWEAADHDYDVPMDADRTHSFTMISRDILSYGTIPFSSPQALKAIAADEYPNGLPAGTYHITLDHGAYNAGTTQDGTYQFTTTQPVPVGGKIRHTLMGAYRSDSDYSKARLLTGTFITYDADYNIIESGLVTTEGSEGASLGTVTAETKSYMVGSHLNSTRRQANGSNRAAHSAQRKWLRSSAAGAASGQIASWWTASDEFDMPVRTTLPGFLHGMDPDFVACIGEVRKRTYLHAWDQGSAAYEDTAETVFQVSMTELGFGNNSNVAECSPKADGTINRSGPYALYDGATNSDRIKRQNGTARYYFFRSAHPSYSGSVRYVGPDGALSGNDANFSRGVVAGLCFT